MYVNKNSGEVGALAAMIPPNQILKTASPDLLRDLDLTNDELVYLLDLASDVKAAPREYAHVLDGKSIALLFEKPSLRTKLTFELAIRQLGGDAAFLEGPIGVREPLKDIARNLDRWFNGLVARVFAQTTVEELAEWQSRPLDSGRIPAMVANRAGRRTSCPDTRRTRCLRASSDGISS